MPELGRTSHSVRLMAITGGDGDGHAATVIDRVARAGAYGIFSAGRVRGLGICDCHHVPAPRNGNFVEPFTLLNLEPP